MELSSSPASLFSSGGVRDRWRHLSVYGFTAATSLALLAVGLDVPVSAQPCDLPVPGEPRIQSLVLSGGTCTVDGEPCGSWVPDGAFVRDTSPLTLHTVADATGKCVLGSMYYLPPPPYCVWSSIEHLRTVNHVNISVDPPTLLTTIHWVWALKPDGGTEYRQHLDTQDPGTTTGPIGVIPSADLGAWKFRSQSIINTTNCNLLPGISDLLEQTVNVTVCKPAWWNDQPQGFTHAVTPHVPARSIDIYVDPTLWGRLGQPARNAANDWTV